MSAGRLCLTASLAWSQTRAYQRSMGHALKSVPPGFDDLSVEEQIDYVQALWERIAEGQRPVTSPEWHRDVVRDRVAEYRANPEAARPWSEVRAELERKK